MSQMALFLQFCLEKNASHYTLPFLFYVSLKEAKRKNENNFFRIGLSIGKRPWLWLLVCFCINCICAPGLYFWREEIDEIDLFVPDNSVIRDDAAWVKTHFRDDFRYESIIVTAPNVLEPEVLRSVHRRS